MNEPKLKLKRKKPSSSDPEQPSTSKPRSFMPTSASFFPQSGGPEPLTTAQSSAPASACSGEKGLWALTLRWVLQELQDTPGLVPELPPLSAVTPLVPSSTTDWDLSDEVPPFPEYSSFQTCPDSTLHSSEPGQDMPLSPRIPHTQTLDPSPLQMQTETHGPKATLPLCQKDQQKPSGRESGRTGETLRTEASRVMTEGLMSSCPMCLLVFPLGFTQLDRDGHLAQCLSEVNMDVTW